MNGLDFYIRVLQPWERDPAFYSPSGPTRATRRLTRGRRITRSIELWTYSFPLNRTRRETGRRVADIPPLLFQARLNLVGNARDLWMAGIGTMQNRSAIS